jgi:hypothetical protein
MHKPNVALQHNGFGGAPMNEAPLRPPQPVVAAPVPVAAPAPEVDLLDFGAFDSAPLSTNAPPSNATFGQSANSAPVANHVFDPFNANPSVSAPAPVAMQIGATGQASSGFGDASFDPFGTMSTSTQPTQPSVPVMNNNFGMMGGMSNNMLNGGMNNVMMNGMQTHMMHNQMQYGGMSNNMMNGMNSNNMMSNNMGMMANNNMMNSNMSMMNNTMMNPMGMPNSGAHNNMSSAPQPAMSMNIMQPMNNSISNNFGSKPVDSGKRDPFAGLGF